MATPANLPPPRPLPVIRDLTVVYVLTLLTAILLVVTSVAGLVLGTRGLYTPDPATLPAFVGQDAITLLAVVPLLLVSTRATRGGSLRGLLAWMAALFYVAYSYTYYVLNPEFNPLYPAYLFIVSMALYGFLYLLVSTDAEEVRARVSERTPVRLIGGFLMVIPTVLGLAWFGMIVSHLATGAIPSRVNQVVWPLDLVVAFPAMFWGGIWIWRRQALGYVVAGLLLLKGGLLGLTLALNTALATFWGTPPDPAAPVYLLGGIGGLALAARYLRDVAPPTPPGTDPPAALDSGTTIRETLKKGGAAS